MVSGHPRYINLGDPKAAVQWFQRLLGDLESLAAADPSNLRARFDLSEADADLGAAYADINPGRAEQLYRRSLALSASFLESNPGDWEALFYQAFNRLEFASVLLRLGKPAQSLAQLQKCVQILDDLARRDPVHPGGRQLLGVALNMRAAQLLKQGDVAESERDQQRSLAILEKLYGENPRSLTLLRDLADSYKGAGDMAVNQSDWKQAQIQYQKSLDLWEHWGNVGTSTIYYRTQREAAARLVARAARRAGKNSSPQ